MWIAWRTKVIAVHYDRFRLLWTASIFNHKYTLLFWSIALKFSLNGGNIRVSTLLCVIVSAHWFICCVDWRKCKAADQNSIAQNTGLRVNCMSFSPIKKNWIFLTGLITPHFLLPPQCTIKFLQISFQTWRS